MSNNDAREGTPFPSVLLSSAGGAGETMFGSKGCMRPANQISIDSGHWANGVQWFLSDASSLECIAANQMRTAFNFLGSLVMVMHPFR